MPPNEREGDESVMNINRIKVLILNHKQQAVEKFGRNSSAVRYYQEGANSDLINDLYQHWFGINEACLLLLII